MPTCSPSLLSDPAVQIMQIDQPQQAGHYCDRTLSSATVSILMDLMTSVYPAKITAKVFRLFRPDPVPHSRGTFTEPQEHG
jgi:hypothetical protein